MNISSREAAPGIPLKFSGSFSAGLTPFGPAELSTHSPRALKMVSSQRGVRRGGTGPLLGGGGRGWYFGCAPSASGVTTQ